VTARPLKARAIVVHMRAWSRLFVGAGLMVAGSALPGTLVEPPFSVAGGLFDQDRPDTLGLEPATGTETFTVFSPGPRTDHFSNGVVLIPFKGRLYAQWQSSPRDEDSPDTWVAYAWSDDGEHWSAPAVLAPAADGVAMHSSGGWWTDGETLVAYVNVWPAGFQSGRGGHADYRLSSDGRMWSQPRRVTGNKGHPVDGIIEQDPHRLPGGRVVAAFHLSPGLVVSPYFTDDPKALTGWTRGRMENLPADGPTGRELEPSLFLRGECAIMVFRDQSSSFRQLASQSCDNGETWTRPLVTSMPDSRSKQGAGNLPDGTAYLVNVPATRSLRLPLAITLSDDGRHFDRAFLLRGGRELQALRFAGRHKRPGYHYPKSVVWNGFLYVGYATNKEDVQVTRVPVSVFAAAMPHESSLARWQSTPAAP